MHDECDYCEAVLIDTTICPCEAEMDPDEAHHFIGRQR